MNIKEEKRPKRLSAQRAKERESVLMYREEREVVKALKASLVEAKKSREKGKLKHNIMKKKSTEDKKKRNNKQENKLFTNGSHSVIKNANFNKKNDKSIYVKPNESSFKTRSSIMSGPLLNKKKAEASTQIDNNKNSTPPVDTSTTKSGDINCDKFKEKPRIIAQRKFAQITYGNYQPFKCTVEEMSTIKELFTKHEPSTEDFLTFLCLRNTNFLPPHLDFYTLNGIKKMRPLSFDYEDVDYRSYQISPNIEVNNLTPEEKTEKKPTRMRKNKSIKELDERKNDKIDINNVNDKEITSNCIKEQEKLIKVNSVERLESTVDKGPRILRSGANTNGPIKRKCWIDLMPKNRVKKNEKIKDNDKRGTEEKKVRELKPEKETKPKTLQKSEAIKSKVGGKERVNLIKKRISSVKKKTLKNNVKNGGKNINKNITIKIKNKAISKKISNNLKNINKNNNKSIKNKPMVNKINEAKANKVGGRYFLRSV